jgi:23S rRNA (uracil1939-C5)-methyltransferase
MGNWLDLDLTDMAATGEAVGRHQNKVVFVPFGMPGDRVRVRVVDDRKRFARAEIIEVLRAGPGRVPPPCRHFGVCGGCQWQHLDYALQLEYKRKIVAEQLSRLGGVENPPVEPAIGMSDPWAYRNHVQFAVTREGRLGFMAARSHEIIPIVECLIIDPVLKDLYADLDMEWPDLERLSLRVGVNTDEVMLVFESADDEAPDLEVDMPVSCVLLRHDGSTFPLMGDSFIHETLGSRRFQVSAPSFFQVNTPGAEGLLELVRQYLEPTGAETLLDLFCGVGTFGLSLANSVARVMGIEASSSAVEDARVNAADTSNFTLIEGPVEESLSRVNEPVHLVVLDPPREGCPPGTLDALLRMRPRRLVYVSCDTATLARDAAILREGGYALQVAQPVDMFPQTRHVETITVWEARESS